MRVYLSVPMIANRRLDRATVMAKAVRDAGHEVASPWVLGSVEAHDPKVVNIFRRDLSGAENSDAILADVSQPSTGVGMEIMAAYKANKRVIVVSERGSVVSRMLLHMDRKETIEFENEDELYRRLVVLLKQEIPSRGP